MYLFIYEQYKFKKKKMKLKVNKIEKNEKLFFFLVFI